MLCLKYGCWTQGFQTFYLGSLGGCSDPKEARGKHASRCWFLFYLFLHWSLTYIYSSLDLRFMHCLILVSLYLAWLQDNTSQAISFQLTPLPSRWAKPIPNRVSLFPKKNLNSWDSRESGKKAFFGVSLSEVKQITKISFKKAYRLM